MAVNLVSQWGKIITRHNIKDKDFKLSCNLNVNGLMVCMHAWIAKESEFDFLLRLLFFFWKEFLYNIHQLLFLEVHLIKLGIGTDY